MAKGSAEWLEGLGAVLIVAGLALWSLAFSLVAAGVFLIVVAAAPAVRPGADDGRSDSSSPGRAGTRAP